jgi:lambda repressor-like predicted transcriptional regulator
MFNLAAECLNRGLTRGEAAKEIGIPDYVLRHAEKGGRPRPAHAKAIADWLGVQATDIWPIEDGSTKSAAA